MSSTLPAPPSSKPAYQVHLPNLEGNNRTSCHSHISEQPQNTYPAPPASHVAESLSMDTLYLPPFWETPRDSTLTIALIHAQRSERRAESRLIRKRLERVKIEHELYVQMEQKTNHRLCKADNGAAITRGGLRACGMFPVVGKDFHDEDSELGSDAEM